jgi:alanine racemase
LETGRGRCWLEVNLSAIRANYRAAADLVGAETAVIPVLKADAYGMGALAVGRALYDEGARLFAVATGDEAEALKAGLPAGARVLTLGLVGRNQAARLIAMGMPLTLFSEKQGRTLIDAARDAGTACDVHIKIDTGLHRLGLDPESAVASICGMLESGTLRVAGLFTHLGIHTPEMDRAQLSKLRAVKDALAAMGIAVPMLHAEDSIGMHLYPDGRMDAVRPGAWVYGVKSHGATGIRDVARFMARVSQLRTVKAGELIGYDDDNPLARDSVIATISAGYVDGTPRVDRCGSWTVEIRGGRAPVIGLACMDQMMADVTDIPGVEEGDEVTFVGGIISLPEYAKMGGFNYNEVWARVGARVPRVYVER